jgi:hypothetical protein
LYPQLICSTIELFKALYDDYIAPEENCGSNNNIIQRREKYLYNVTLRGIGATIFSVE